MSDYPWVIDDLNIVHHKYCSLIYGTATPYGSLATTDAEVFKALQRPDVSNKRKAPSPLVPCDHCIVGKVPVDD